MDRERLICDSVGIFVVPYGYLYVYSASLGISKKCVPFLLGNNDHTVLACDSYQFFASMGKCNLDTVSLLDHKVEGSNI